MLHIELLVLKMWYCLPELEIVYISYIKTFAACLKHIYVLRPQVCISYQANHAPITEIL